MVVRATGALQRLSRGVSAQWPWLQAWAGGSHGLSSSACVHEQAQQEPARERMDYDLCIVGAGPAGLAAAIRFKQLCKEEDKEFSVCIIEKGSEVGAHILSGNVLEPRALEELFPEWSTNEELADIPVKVKAKKDYFYWLTGKRALRMPTPRQMHNKGNYVISLSELCRWLGAKAEEAGVEIYPGFAGKEVLYDWHGRVAGVATGDFGIAKDGSRKDTYAPGVDLMARLTLFGEGCRGSLSESIMKRFALRDKADANPQTYALGLKEVWELPEGSPGHSAGDIYHTVGYPLDQSTYGGGFLYHMGDRRIALGLVLALDYRNPYLNTFQEFQRWKAHPLIAKQLEGGTCLQYGARSLNEGGVQSIPQLAFPGGALIGCSAGFLNVPKIKGTHTAMKSGIIAAEEAFTALKDGKDAKKDAVALSAYPLRMENSWVYQELNRERNIRPGFRHGLLGGLANAALTTYITRGREPWTLQHRHADNEALRPAKEYSPIEYPKPDGTITFDLPTSLYRSGTNHEHDQPPHLRLRSPGLPEVVNKPIYAGPEARYCPAGVYEYQADESSGGQRQKLHINAQNCLHCKACDIKDPQQNIQWTVPEGGGGPNYTVM